MPARTRETTALATENEILRESVAELELALEDQGWAKLTGAGAQQFSRAGLGNAATIARTMAVANPLIKRGLNVRQAYVFGQGVTVAARAGENEPQDVNAVVQAFWDDEGNRSSLTGDQAQELNERTLGTDGNVFLAHFTSPLTGFVQVRTIPFDEMQHVITNPEDRSEPWFYRREWTAEVIDPGTGRTTNVQRVDYYPALAFRPASRPRRIDDYEVHWDSPVLHIAVNRLDGWKFGIGDAYAALPWARAYKDFLGDWATLVKALSQFAWRATTGKGSRAQQLRQALTRTPASTAPGNPGGVGGTAVMGSDITLEAIPKSGATIDSESGKPLAAMVASALDVPVTVLLGDPGQTGARAVAETLEWPTMLAMMQRQSLWANAYRATLEYVIKASVRAPQGVLKGAVIRDPITGREVVQLAQDTDPAVEITFPPLDELPLNLIIEAIAKADEMRKLPPLEIARLILKALKIQNADDILDELTDDDGNWLDPYGEALGAAADRFRSGGVPTPDAATAATDAARAGTDPAEVV